MFSFCVELRLLLLHICRSITNIANIAHTPCAAGHGFYFRQLYQLRMQFAFRAFELGVSHLFRSLMLLKVIKEF